jgi:hypothetical protein
MYTTPVTVHVEKRRGLNTFCLFRTQKALHLGLSLMPCHCMQVVAPPDSSVMSVNTPGLMENGIIAKHSFSWRVHHQVLKEHYSKMYSKLFALVYYI